MRPPKRFALVCVALAYVTHRICAVFHNKNSSNTQSDTILFTARQSGVDLYNCEGIRRRRDIRDLSPARVRKWRKIMKELINARSKQRTSFWDLLVRVHITFTNEAHRGSYFLPWHRQFLLVLENYIRSQGHPKFTLPYWDWSAEAANAALSDIWDSFYVGGARQRRLTRAPKPIPNGSFAQITGRFPRPHTVLRNFSSGVSGTIRQLVDESLLTVIINASKFSTFSINMELAHDLVHVGIGGDMRLVDSAPNDPVFYLHHAFVDYVYSRRQVLFGVKDFDGVHNFPGNTQPAYPNYEFQAFGRTAEQGFSTPCVKYVPYSKQTKSSRTARTVADDYPDLSILWKACKDNEIRMGIAKADCMKAVQALIPFP